MSQLLVTDAVDQHPCFDERASYHFGRIHLPVAPKCNIQCNYCHRRYDCVNESRPGVVSRLISPGEAVSRVETATEMFPTIKVVGIAGPGEPLFNQETFETLRLVNDRFPTLHKCLSTNGLLLLEKVASLEQLGLATITVTLNAIDPVIGDRIYSFISYHGEGLEGTEAAAVLLHNQLTGIEMAVEAGIAVKVNTIVIPGVNDSHIAEVAKKSRELGVFVQNIVPVIPLFKFAHIGTPLSASIKRLRGECALFIKQMTHCQQCRADAIGLLHRDMSLELFTPSAC